MAPQGRRKGIQLPRPPARRALIPPISWGDVESRFGHLEELVLESGRDIPHLSYGSMTHAPDGGPMRRVPTPSAPKHEGHIQSVKNRRTMHWEARGENLLILRCEVDTAIRTYKCQPHRLELYTQKADHTDHRGAAFRFDLRGPAERIRSTFKHEQMIYFPDMERHATEAPAEIIEVKEDYKDAAHDLDYVRKLVVAKRFYERVGLKFTLLTANDDLDIPNTAQNVRRVAIDRHAKLSSTDLLTISLHLSRRNGTSTYGEMILELQNLNSLSAPANRAKIHAAIVRRLVGIDLSKRLQSSTIVWGIADNFPSLREVFAEETNGIEG